MADPTDDIQIDVQSTPPREEYDIKVEIDEAQANLEQNLSDLKDAILDKVDVKAHIERAIDDGKEQVVDAAVEVRNHVVELYKQARQALRDRPLLVVGVIGGVALLAGAAFAARRSVKHAID